MSWLKLDDQFPDHPKITKAGPVAAWLYVCGLAYCGRFLTDGAIPKEQVRRLADIDDAMTHAAKLVSVGLWHEAEEGYIIHDYHKYNPTANEVREHKQDVSQKRSEAGSKGAVSRWQNHSKDYGKNGKTDGKTIAPSPSPSPSLLIPSERPITIDPLLIERPVSVKNGTQNGPGKAPRTKASLASVAVSAINEDDGEETPGSLMSSLRRAQVDGHSMAALSPPTLEKEKPVQTIGSAASGFLEHLRAQQQPPAADTTQARRKA